MQQQLSLLLLLLGCHLITADEGIVDRCDMMCSRYMACLENQAAGKPDFKTCMKPRPPCICVAMPEKQPETKMAGDDIIYMCDTACERYFKCRNQTPKGPCVMPPGCRCAQLPEVANGELINQCGMICAKYITCLQNQAAGKLDFKTCMKPMPPCQCGPSPEIQPVPCVHCNEHETKMAGDDIIHMCDTACQRYCRCLKENPAGFCRMLPGCRCAPLPEMQPETKMAGDDIIHMCDTACDRYFKCRNQTPKGPCVMPPGCMCHDLPDKAVVMPMLPDPCKPCMDYWMCRRFSMGNLSPSPCDQLKSKECQCNMHHCFQRGICEEDMPDELRLQQKIPCLKPDCGPDEEMHNPMKDFCNLLCNKHRKCLAENNPQKPCELPSFCNCPMPLVGSMAVKEIPKKDHCPMEVCGMYWNCIVEKMGRPDKQELACNKPRFCECECLDVDTEDCIENRFMQNMAKTMPEAMKFQPLGLEQCQPEMCADYWMCTWIALRDEKVSCLRPQGCVCNCAAAGICAQADIPGIARVAFGAQYVWPPPVIPIHDMTCSYSCAKFSLCKKLFEHDRCHLTGSCECGMLPVREVEPKHP